MAGGVVVGALALGSAAVMLDGVVRSGYVGGVAGKVVVLCSRTVGAAESAIGLAILVVLFRTRSTIAVDELDTLKG